MGKFFCKQNNSLARKANEGSLLPVDGEWLASMLGKKCTLRCF